MPFALGEGQFKRTDKDASRVARLDHVVDQAAGGGNIGVVEALLVFFSQLAAFGFGVRRLAYFFAEEDVDRASVSMTAISALGQA